MSGLLSFISGSLWKFVMAWVIPALVAVSTFAFAVFPAVEDLPVAERLAAQSELQRLTILAFSVLVLAVLLAALSTRIYRFLEGYMWPKWAKRRGIARQKRRWEKLNRRLDALEGSEAPQTPAWERELLVERLKKFPESSEHLLPTRLGNAFKALERYGNERYRLSSQTMWTELVSLAPEPLRGEIDNARGVLDFFISFLCSAVLLFVFSCVIGLTTQSPAALLTAAIALAMAPAFYAMAVASTSWYRKAMQGLVNLGRPELAKHYGLKMPQTIEEERQMWQALMGFVIWGNDAYAKRLDEYRAFEEDQEGDSVRPEDKEVAK